MRPWIVYGQTMLGADNEPALAVNPACHHNGVMGESDLPYMVPTDKVLVLKRITLEPLWSAAIIPFISDEPTLTTESSLCTFSSGGLLKPNMSVAIYATQDWACEYYIPGGKTLNMRINAGVGGWIYGWAMHGELRDAAEFC